MKINKKTLKADSGKPFQGGEICSSRRILLQECFLSPIIYNKAVQLHGAHSIRHKAALELAERRETGCRGGKCQSCPIGPRGFTEHLPPHPPTEGTRPFPALQYIH